MVTAKGCESFCVYHKLNSCGPLKDVSFKLIFHWAVFNRFLLNKTIDVLLYVERLDAYRVDNLDKQVIKAITDSFGKEIWKRGVVVLTHAQLSPPDGLNYEDFFSKRSEALMRVVRSGARLRKQDSQVCYFSTCRGYFSESPPPYHDLVPLAALKFVFLLYCYKSMNSVLLFSLFFFIFFDQQKDKYIRRRESLLFSLILLGKMVGMVTRVNETFNGKFRVSYSRHIYSICF